MANLLELAPNGLEEERGPGWVEFAIYGPPGEVPELGELQAAAGGSLVDVTTTSVPDDWADRWVDFHRPIEVGRQDRRSPVLVGPAGRPDRRRRRSRPRLRHRRPSDDPPLPRAADRARGGRRGIGPDRRLGHRLGRPGDRGGEARLERRSPAATASTPRSRPRRPMRRPTASSWRSSASTCARAAPPVAPTVVANLTGQSAPGLRRPPRRRRRGAARRSSAPGCWRARSTRWPTAFAPTRARGEPAADRARVGRRCSCARAGLPDGARAQPELPIAMFDSGVGGLTVLHECLVSLPEEDYVYLGDDARFPYGARTHGGASRARRAGQPLPAGARGEAAGDRLQLGRVGGPGGRQGDRGRGGHRGGDGDRSRGGDRRGAQPDGQGRRARDARHGAERRLPPRARSASSVP